jgi:hypothetical protein
MSVRKRTWTILGGGAALALTVTAASAAEDMGSANGVLPGCRGMLARSSNATDPLTMGLCAGIVRGIASMGSVAVYVWNRVPLDRKAPLAPLCMDIPEKVTTDQEIRVVIAYIDARPQRMHEDFADLALEALRAAWPCR